MLKNAHLCADSVALNDNSLLSSGRTLLVSAAPGNTHFISYFSHFLSPSKYLAKTFFKENNQGWEFARRFS